MGLRWTAEQLAIYNLIQSGATNKDLKAQGYKLALVKKVKAAMNKGDAPPKAREEKEEKKETPPGEPLYSATLKTTKVTLDPMVVQPHLICLRRWRAGEPLPGRAIGGSS